jgi:hypothetical protein
VRLELAAAIAALSSSPLLLAQSFPCFEPTFGVNLSLGDDQVAPGMALGFTFPGPGGGNVTAIDISSNGFVWLGTNPNPRCCNGEAAKLVMQTPSICPLWVDLDPTTAAPGGGVFFNTFPAAGSVPARAVVTWAQVPEFNGSGVPFTFQLQMDSTGAIFFYYDANISLQNHTALVGVSEGNTHPSGVASSNFIDISQNNPPIDTGLNPTFYEELPSWAMDLQNRTFEIQPNGQGGYTINDPPNCVPAAWSVFGGGCPREPVFYEHFVSPNAIDLGNTAMLAVPNGVGGWTVIPTTGFYTPTSAPIQTFDDFVTGPFALPWTWNWSNGSTSSIDVSSNGFIWLNSGNGDSRCCSGDPSRLLFDPASICGNWTDLAPHVAGSIHVDTDPLTLDVHVTWLGVPEYANPGALNTFQITLSPNGSFRLSYQNVSVQGHDSLTGFSPGNVLGDPGSIDFSLVIPFDTGAGGTPLRLDSVGGATPQIGTTFPLELSGVAPGSLLGFMILGLAQFVPGFDLAVIGMPGCTQYVSLDAAQSFPLLPQPQLGIPLPNNTGLVGFQIYVQGATLTPGINPLGLAVSNAGVMSIGI